MRNWILAFCLLFLFLGGFCLSKAGAANLQDSSTLRPPAVSQIQSCIFNFEDTYSGTDSGLSLPSAAGAPYGSGNYPGYFGTTVQLQFNNYGNNYAASQYTQGYGSPTQYTPNLPCDGHYEIIFTVDLRNDSGLTCNYGENSMAVWVTTTDAASPSAYGCPVSYLDAAGTPHVARTGTSSVNSCATFSQWVQCAWTNNYNATQESGYGEFLQHGVQGFPMFMYTPTWTYQHGGRVHSVYPGMCNEYTGDPAWAWFYNQYYGCTGPGQFANSYQTAFCTYKPFNFKNVVYLHKGTQISAPALASQMIFTPWTTATQAGQAQCSFSVVGGRFKVIYLGP